MADQFKTFDKAPIVGVVNVKQWSFAIREIVVATIALFLFIMCILFIALYANEKASNKNTNVLSPAAIQQQYCVGKDCMETASHSLKLINSSVDPCEDFYEFACGNYRTENPLYFTQPMRSTLNDIRDLNDRRMLNILERPPTRTDSWAYQKKLYDFFNVCKNSYLRQKSLGRPFLEQIVDKLGGWDLLGTWDEASWDFNKALKLVQKDFDVDAFYGTQVTADANNPKRRVIQLIPAGTGKWMSLAWFNQPEAKKYQDGYRKFMRTVGSLLMRDANLVNMTQEEKETRLNRFINDTFLLEAKLAHTIQNTPIGEDPHLDINKVSVQDLDSEAGGMLDWTGQLSYIYEKARVSGKTRLMVIRRGYFKNVTNIIESLPAADRNRILHHYLIWRCAEQYVQDLSWEYIHANREFYEDINGYTSFMGVENFCISQIHYNMRDALGALFVQEHFADTSKTKVSDITENLKIALQHTLDKTPWMDEKTRKFAKAKLDLVTFKLGYPDWMAKESVIDGIYSEFTVNNTDLLSSVLSANQYQLSEETKALVEGENRQKWIFGVYSTTVAVFWYWNEIIASAGVLQSPIYDSDAPMYTTFGSLGGILGRYLHHVVDDWGEHYGLHGEQLQDKSWWSQHSLEAYKPVQQCVNTLYGQAYQTIIRPDGSPLHVAVNPYLYTPVGIATTSGLRLAVKGYRDWIASRGAPEKMLPGLAMSAEQMIFLSYAQGYCYNKNDLVTGMAVIRGQMLDDLRINMAMGQLKEFADAFQCKKGSKMNPEQQCTYY